MYNVSNELRQEMFNEQDTISLEHKLEMFDMDDDTSFVIENEIVSITESLGVDGIPLGKFPIGVLEFELRGDITQDIDVNSNLEVGISHIYTFLDESTEVVDGKRYIIQEIEYSRESRNTSIKAYDYAVKLSQEYNSSDFNLPLTLKEFTMLLYQSVGLEIYNLEDMFNKNYQLDRIPGYDTGVPILEVARDIGEVSLSLQVINYANKVEFIDVDDMLPKESDDEVHSFKSFKAHSDEFKTLGINTLVLGLTSDIDGENTAVSDNSMVNVDGNVELRFDGNQILWNEELKQNAIDNMFEKVKGFKYKAFESENKYFFLGLGDTFRQIGQGENEQDYDVLVLSNETKFEGSVLSTLSAESKSVKETENKWEERSESKRTEILVDKANQKITAVVEDLDDEKERVSQLSIDLDQIRAEVTEVNFGSILVNANGELDNYQDWKDFASNDGVIVFDGIKVLENMTSTTIFEILSDTQVLGGTKLSFFGNGKQEYELRPIVDGYEYSYRAKRVSGTQPRTVEINEYDSDQVYLRKRSFVFDGTDTYEDIPNLSFENDVKFISITYIISGVSVSNRLEIAETMFAIGSPKLYYRSADNVSYWASSEIKQLSDEMSLKVDVDGVVSAINLQPGTVKIDAKNLDLTGLVTIANLAGNGTTVINGANITTGTISADRINFDGATGSNVNLTGKITATSGKIGGYTISGDNLVGNNVSLKPNEIQIGRTVIEETGSGTSATLRMNAYRTELGDSGSTGNWLFFGGRQFLQGFPDNGFGIFVGSIARDTTSSLNGNIGGSGPNERFNTIYLSNQPNVSSDLRHKFAIQDIPQDLIERLSEIKPKMYLQKDKWHFGYIAQDVERALFLWATKRYGKDAKHYVDKFAMLHKDESMLSLLYGELAVLKGQQMISEINSLKERLDNFELHSRYK